MIINSAVIAAISLNVNTLFNTAFGAATPLHPRIAVKVPTTAKGVKLPWLGGAKKMREWIGERNVTNIEANLISIETKDYELTIGIERNDIEDDNIGAYSPLIQEMGNAAALHPDELLATLMEAGPSTVCYDGQYFFDDDHPRLDGLAAQSNDHALALSAANFATVYEAMRAITDDRGKAINVTPNLLVVPPALEFTAKAILKDAFASSGATNTTQNVCDYVVMQDLTSATGWYLLDTTKPIKPFVFVERKSPEMVALDKSNDANVFMNKEYLYGVDGRYAMGYGLWQLAAYSIG